MLRVMIIDDDFNVRKCLRTLIPWADIGCELVAEASDGAEGLAQFQSVQPNVIISDLKMPEMSGEELCSKVRAISDQVTFIFISAYEDFSVAQRALHYGVAEYILKPIDARKLQQISVLLKDLASSYSSRFVSHKLINDSSFQREVSKQLKYRNSAYIDEFFIQLSNCREFDFHLLMSTCSLLINLLFDAVDDSSPNNLQLQQLRQSALSKVSGLSRKQDIISYCHELYTNYLNDSLLSGESNEINSKIVAQVQQYIQQNISWQQLSLSVIAAHFDFSDDYLNRAFRKETGTTINGFITSVRTSQACRLLKQTQLSISEIAQSTGYASTNYFCRNFKKQTGLTPNEFRVHERDRNIP